MEFDHLGLTTEEKKDNENWDADLYCWWTDPQSHPYKIEWIRYEKNSPTTGPLRDRPHIAFKVDSLEKASAGLKVLFGPIKASETLTICYYEYKDGTVVELMEYHK